MHSFLLTLQILVAAVLALGVVLIARESRRAESGFEDEHGFHRGKPTLRD